MAVAIFLRSGELAHIQSGLVEVCESPEALELRVLELTKVNSFILPLKEADTVHSTLLLQIRPTVRIVIRQQ